MLDVNYRVINKTKLFEEQFQLLVSYSLNTISSIMIFLLGSVRLCEQQMKLINKKKEKKKKKVEESEPDDNEEDVPLYSMINLRHHHYDLVIIARLRTKLE